MARRTGTKATRPVAVAAVVAALLAAVTWATPTNVGCGPADTACGPAIVLGVTTTTGGTTTTTLATVSIPAIVGADTNCATSGLPTSGQDSVNGWATYASWTQTCPTGANAAGYNATSVSVYIHLGTAGAFLKCSVYTDATPNAHVAAGCDTTQVTLTANPTAWLTLATTGTCHLAAGTRYWIACATPDNALTFGQPTAACASCWKYASSPYPALWPATLSSTGSYNVAMSAYLTATPGP